MRPAVSIASGAAAAALVAALLAVPATASGQNIAGAGHDQSQSPGGGNISSAGGSGGSAPISGAGPTGSPAPISSARPSSDGASDSGPSRPRPRGDRDPTGRAVPRSGAPPRDRNSTVIVTNGSPFGGYYPWGYGGLGLGGYYGGYDPWRYDPYSYGQSYPSGYEGRLRLKVKPSNAEVFVDGYYAGVVDEFDNIFQHLRIETGPHRIEVREDGYEPLTVEVRIVPGRTVTYKGELKKTTP